MLIVGIKVCHVLLIVGINVCYVPKADIPFCRLKEGLRLSP